MANTYSNPAQINTVMTGNSGVGHITVLSVRWVNPISELDQFVIVDGKTGLTVLQSYVGVGQANQTQQFYKNQFPAFWNDYQVTVLSSGTLQISYQPY